MNLKSIYKLGSPPLFYKLCIVLEPWYLISSILLIAVGMYGGLFVAPPDYQMGDAFRIIYFHVPSAYVSMMAYVFMAVSAIIGLIFEILFYWRIGKHIADIRLSEL
jgi:heme exporter protein C